MSKLQLPKTNIVILAGRLTKDVELRFTPNGTPVAKLSLAFDRSYQKDGEWQQETSYLDVVVWEKRGEKCAEKLKKGSPVLVEGYIKTRSYEKDGINRKVTEIVAHKVSFLEREVKRPQPEDFENKPEHTDEDLPF